MFMYVSCFQILSKALAYISVSHPFHCRQQMILRMYSIKSCSLNNMVSTCPSYFRSKNTLNQIFLETAHTSSDNTCQRIICKTSSAASLTKGPSEHQVFLPRSLGRWEGGVNGVCNLTRHRRRPRSFLGSHCWYDGKGPQLDIRWLSVEGRLQESRTGLLQSIHPNVDKKGPEFDIWKPCVEGRPKGSWAGWL